MADMAAPVVDTKVVMEEGQSVTDPTREYPKQRRSLFAVTVYMLFL